MELRVAHAGDRARDDATTGSDRRADRGSSGRLPQDEPRRPLPPGELLGRRAGVVLVIAVSMAFIGSSSWQIIPAVFGARIDPIPAAAEGSADRRCAVGVRSLLGALDRVAGDGRPNSRDGDEMAAALRARLSPEWDQAATVDGACAASSQGMEAWAALQRMKTAEEQPIRMGRDAVAELRVEVTEHLPPDLR
jgi:hypothetical protein